ncbi:MAG: hypothetical protein COA85_13990, partial [Robiginitomaculum sp.]
MNIKKLLATTAIVAMAATAAHSTIAIVGNNVDTAGTDVIANVVLANELDLTTGLGSTGTALTGTFEYLVSFANAVPNEQLKIKIDLPTGTTFNGPMVLDPTGDSTGTGLAATSLLDADNGGANATDDFSAASVSLGGGGGASTATVVFLPNVAMTNIRLRLALSVNSVACPASGAITVNVTTTAAGTPVEGGSASTTGDVISCTNAITSIAAAVDANDSKAALPTFTSLIVGGTGIAADTATRGVIGTLTATLKTVPSVPVVDLAGTAFAPATHMNNTTFTVDLSDTGALAANGVKVTLNAAAPGAAINGVAQAAPNANKFDFTIANGNAGAFTTSAGTFDLNFDGTTAIAARTASVGAIQQTFTGGPDFKASTSYGGTVNLDTIEQQNSTFGPFAWVGGANSSSRNIFRFTGMSADSLAGTVTFSNMPGSATSVTQS